MIVDVTKLAYDWLFVSIMVRDVSFCFFFGIFICHACHTATFYYLTALPHLPFPPLLV